MMSQNEVEESSHFFDMRYKDVGTTAILHDVIYEWTFCYTSSKQEKGWTQNTFIRV